MNQRIRVPRVLVIDEEGNKIGEFLTEDAIALAQERGFDLVEVAPNARPPVCRITDFGKLKYEKKKKAAVAKRNQVQVTLKEVKLRPKTDDHDLKVKVGHVRRFLQEGNKVKITVRFRGRELAHRDIGVDQCQWVAEAVGDLAVIESPPRMEGRQMFMLLAPTHKPVPKVRDPEPTRPTRSGAPVVDRDVDLDQIPDESTSEEDLDEDDDSDEEDDDSDEKDDDSDEKDDDSDEKDEEPGA